MDDLSEVRSQLLDPEKGFYVARGFFDRQEVLQYRDECMGLMRTGPVVHHRIATDWMFDYVHPRSPDNEKRTYRLYRFLHNHHGDLTDRMFTKVLQLRNEIESLWKDDPVYRAETEILQEYVQITQYVDEHGLLARHRDYHGPAKYPLLQFWTVISDPEVDYEGGNLILHTRDGKSHRVEGDLKVGVGDALFFDKSLDHEVESVRRGPGEDAVGRWTLVGARSERMSNMNAFIRRWKYGGKVYDFRKRVDGLFKRQAA